MPRKTSRQPPTLAITRTEESSAPKGVLPDDEEGPGLLGAGLSWTKSRIRDLDSDKTIPCEQRDLLRLYYTREREKLQLKLRISAFGWVIDHPLIQIEPDVQEIHQLTWNVRPVFVRKE